MKYNRLTPSNENLIDVIISITMQEPKMVIAPLLQLWDLENKIERGELISTKQEERSDQELAFFAEHNKSVRELFADDLKVCLQDAVKRGDITREAYEVVVGEINYCL